MFYVYVLRSASGLYIGYTGNLKTRLTQHNAGKSTYTMRNDNWEVIYYEAHLSKEDARRRERYFKTSPGKQSLKPMLRYTFSKEQSS